MREKQRHRDISRVCPTEHLGQARCFDSLTAWSKPFSRQRKTDMDTVAVHVGLVLSVVMDQTRREGIIVFVLRLSSYL